jgi:hypothetical protein
MTKDVKIKKSLLAEGQIPGTIRKIGNEDDVKAGQGGSHLSLQLLGIQRSGGLWFEARPCKKLARPLSQPISHL